MCKGFHWIFLDFRSRHGGNFRDGMKDFVQVASLGPDCEDTWAWEGTWKCLALDRVISKSSATSV